MTRPVIEGMRERKWGRIIQIASINGQKGQYGQANYAAAKAGMHGFTTKSGVDECCMALVSQGQVIREEDLQYEVSEMARIGKRSSR